MLGGLSAIGTRPGSGICLLTLTSPYAGFHASAPDDLRSGPTEATPAHADVRVWLFRLIRAAVLGFGSEADGVAHQPDLLNN